MLRPMRSLLVVSLALAGTGSFSQSEGVAGSNTCPAIVKVRILPREGHADKLLRARITGSNENATSGFETLAEIKTPPSGNNWLEVPIPSPQLYRFIKLETASGSWANVAELEFCTADGKALGMPFGTTGSRDQKENDFAKALDGDPGTFFEAAEPNNQYVGLDFGVGSQTAPPVFVPPPGTQPGPFKLTLSSASPGAVIRFTRGGGTPTRDRGEVYQAPILVEAGAIVVAVAAAEALAASAPVVGSYRIGSVSTDQETIRTFHIGNSLTDTVDGWLKPVAESAGRSLEFHRFTIPGAPTDWLWNHPGSGFGDSRFTEAFFAFAPFHHLFLQPFAGHGRSIANETEYVGRFYDACQRHSPKVKLWVYQQWPSREYNESWSQGRIPLGSERARWQHLALRPGETLLGEPHQEAALQTGLKASNWETAVTNHTRYFEILIGELRAKFPGTKIGLVPAGPALLKLKREMESSQPAKPFFSEIFSDGVHLTPKGRYLVALVHYAVLFEENPAGKVSPLNTGLSEAEAKRYQAIAWETVNKSKP